MPCREKAGPDREGACRRSTMTADGPPRMVKRPTGSGGEPSSPNCVVSAGGKARQPHKRSPDRSRIRQPGRETGSGDQRSLQKGCDVTLVQPIRGEPVSYLVGEGLLRGNRFFVRRPPSRSFFVARAGSHAQRQPRCPLGVCRGICSLTRSNVGRREVGSSGGVHGCVYRRCAATPP
jgi:hypothetical protein